MTAAMHDATDVWRSPEDELLEAFLALDTPQGFKAELIEGEIVVTPPPDGDHETAIGRIVKQVFQQCTEDFDFGPGKGLVVPSGRFIPDGTFVLPDAMAGKGSWSTPDGVVMTVEVTSTNPAKDRGAKRRGYAAAGIPLYLLVDRKAGQVVLHSHPEGGDYTATTSVPFGDPLLLPKPFGFELATDRLG
ncbi:Uma2 family endonuclease [Kitasatospora cineracea]|uniref:Uma2 family endonuclease n=1 Tax=Kitasatospora cineracea TaxID=88074 RepID=A0A8G1XBC4_9ACTN|nr:Uma2 family endonuclease [Kitasatospora cineracea]ROR41991.1 Uma2 family endonuclease [Kitasatospora cineracea]